MATPITHLDGETVFTNDRLRLVRERFATPDGEQERAIIYHPGAVVVLAEPKQGSLLMVRQYRYALRRETLEVPAGTMNPGEEAMTTAYRELEEETGYAAAQMEAVCQLYPSVGFSDEIQHFFKASDLTATAMNADSGEFVAPEILDQAAINDAIRSGLICDAKTLLAIQLMGLSWTEAMQSS